MLSGDGPSQLGEDAARLFAASERMNQLLLEHLVPEAWSASPPGNVRTIAAIFTHMHNVRCKWIRLTAPYLKVPAQLHRTQSTRQEVRHGMAESGTLCSVMLSEALDNSGRIESFRRDGWAPAWPARLDMLCYMLAHEAHHRGQALMVAHQLGFPLPRRIWDGIWNWQPLSKQPGQPKKTA
jgi:uncharacterized damage-inducible protein DinB